MTPRDASHSPRGNRFPTDERRVADLEWLLSYELLNSDRHRRFLSVVMLSSDGGRDQLDQLLEGVLRNSDPCFCLEAGTIIMMGETDTTGALRAVERYRGAVDGRFDVRYGVSTFPRDGRTSADLMHTARQRLERARDLDSGAVVAED